MRITILVVRKLKERYWKQAIAEYEKRLGPYTRMDIIEVPGGEALENMNDKEIEQVKERKGQQILAKIRPQSTIIILKIQGEMLFSEGLAQELNQRMTQEQSDFVFVISGSNGLHKDALQRNSYTLSFSEMTFSHQMTRVVLIEQVYRVFKTTREEAHHK